MEPPTRVHAFFARQTRSELDQFLDLVSNPFQTQVASEAFFWSLGSALGITAVIALLFCLLRPYNTVVYAPKLKYADEKHAPPVLGKSPLAWIGPVVKTKEQMLVEKIGLDATLFLRFTAMCRNIFLVSTVVGCGILIPVNVISGKGLYRNFGDVSTFMKMTPQYMFGKSFWALVVCAWLFDIIICLFLWSNYRAAAKLRREYFESPEYRASLHSRTLMVYNIPREFRSDEGIVRILHDVKGNAGTPTATIARNVKELPELIEQQHETVRELESYLAKYFKNPKKLPAMRPLMKPYKEDKAQYGNEKVDAINYLRRRMGELQSKIDTVKDSIDRRDALPYGFASFDTMEEAHSVAYAVRKKHPHGVTIRLAPKPTDVIWKNMPLSNATRRRRNVVNNFWVGILTVLWIVPNALIAVFLSNLAHLGQLWPAFQTQLNQNKTTWSLVQGILAPAITSAFYYFLPAIFRRLSMKAGDLSKTSRERHVVHKLYSFFVFNNLIVFSIFSAVWIFVVAIIAGTKDSSKNWWQVVKEGDLWDKLMLSLCNVSPFWVIWLLQRNLIAAVDLAQFANLAWGSIVRTFFSPTPRQIIDSSAPPVFEYASYYNYFLFYATVAFVYGTLQPIVLPVTAFYFVLDAWLKKYLLLYVCTTKHESGGAFWRVLYNRFLFAAFLGNCAIALVVTARGYSWSMLGSLAPLPFLLLAHKWYCSHTFDNQMHYYTMGASSKDVENAGLPERKPRKRDQVGVRYCHPALVEKPWQPMVNEKARHLLASIYTDRSPVDDSTTDIPMHELPRDVNAPGTAKAPSEFEFVAEGDMDFQNFKNRAEFRAEHGGDGELYGGSINRPGTPGSFTTLGTSRHRSESRDSSATRVPYDDGAGTEYPKGYHQTPATGYGFQRTHSHSPGPVGRQESLGDIGAAYKDDGYNSRLLGHAAPMGGAITPGAITPGSEYAYGGGFGPSTRTPGEDTSYDYFRRGRQGGGRY